MKKEIQRAAEKWNDQYSRKRVSWRRLQRSQLRLSSRLANIPDFKGSVIDAIAYRLSNARPDQMYSKAISVGCGTGESEMYLVRHGIVTHFDLFEISEVAIKRGKSIAKQWGLQDRVTFHLGDVFTYPISNDYDLVYWHHSLHHMLDVSKAVEFSKNILKVGGIFSAYEYVGPNRFQFSDTNLSIANRILETLPDHLLKNPEDPQKLLPRHQQRVALKRIIADDPTEAVDSENIIPAIQSHFPQAEITTLSANIARLVLGYILQNLSEDEDDLLINLVLLVDDMAIQLGIHHDAFILASKNSEESENHSGKDAKNFSECSGATSHPHQAWKQIGYAPKPLQPKEQMFFLHIPKAAGTTLISLLAQHFEEKEICPFYYPLELTNVTPEQLRKYRFVRGHFHYEVVERLLPKTTSFVTVLRNPIERYLSHFYYWKQKPEVINARPDFVKKFIETPLAQFVHLTNFHLTLEISNYQAKWIALTVNQWDTVEEWIKKVTVLKMKTSLNIDLGKERLAQFEIVGLAERFQETLLLLSYHFGWPPLLNTSRLNITANRPTQRDIAPETLESIRQLNQLDEELYIYAEQLFEDHMQHMTHHLLESHGSRRHAHLAYPLSVDVLAELLEKYHAHFGQSR